jgi:hypothetical protein
MVTMATMMIAFSGDFRLPLRRGRRVTLSFLLPELLRVPLVLADLLLLLPLAGFFLAGFFSATVGSQEIENLETDHADIAGTEGHDDVAGLSAIDKMAGDS